MPTTTPHPSRRSRTRRLLRALAAPLVLAIGGLAAAGPAAATTTPPPDEGIVSITPITQVLTFGQKVVAVAVEYGADVDPAELSTGDFSVLDSPYNFRAHDPADLDALEPRTVTAVYTSDEPALRADGSSTRGSYVVVELDPEDSGGNTVVRSACDGFLCSEKLRESLPTHLVQLGDVHGYAAGGAPAPLLAAGSQDALPMTEAPVNLVAEEFHSDVMPFPGADLPYSYRLPDDYDPARTYPLVVVLHGWGSGFDGVNHGVNVAVDIMATSWAQPEWTGSEEDVIVLAPQNVRGDEEVEWTSVLALLEQFTDEYSVDEDRTYVTTFSWGSTIAWNLMADQPELFDAALIVSGFPVSEEQAASIATARTPVWITHATSDPVLPPDFGRTSAEVLRAAYTGAGADDAGDLVRFTEYADDAFTYPDYHAATGPTYSDSSILRWVLAQDRSPNRIESVTPVTEVSSFGQQVTGVVLEYADVVDPASLGAEDFTVRDTSYNFRFTGLEELENLVERDVAGVYTTDDPARLLEHDRSEAPGRYVVLDLEDDPNGGWTVMVSLCPTFLCSVMINPDQPTEVVQAGDVHAPSAAVISRGDADTAWPLTEPAINREVDQFVHATFESDVDGVEGDDLTVRYDYRLPDDYDPAREYPLVVALSGHGMGFDGQNERVQLVADMPATAWFQEEWTGTDEEVIVLAPQNARVGKELEAAQVLQLLEDFTGRFSVDERRVYATSVSYGSQLMWEMFSTRPELFAGGLLTGGFAADEDEYALIAAAEVPMWITHGTSDHLLPVEDAKGAYDALVAAYRDRGLAEERIAELALWTEYGDEAFSLPDYHLASAPTYEDSATLQWLLAQVRPGEDDGEAPGEEPGDGGGSESPTPDDGAEEDETPAGPGGRLPTTGVPAAPILAALVLLVTGGAVVLGVRRRSTS
ncbi:Predicted peptidase [Georgenia satyanarayanai]|uniref:Predicted peptidase n=1 Tax=Georgenia satyanarayanai TaxID=860221 RepID=A0A2Y8ZWJ7_9MICO|nr:PHB depolymerase family esterase [Georgenia satyanarayanai]PYG01908.1 putative peptidase [Georgenia satyanarayanai]SSA36711.1 Predicted peptidase [Georgenia satyanarayanai]